LTSFLDHVDKHRTAVAIDFEAMEIATRTRALEVASSVLCQWLNSDASDYAGPTMPCPHCGGTASYHGRRVKRVVTALGTMDLSRAYYHDASCGHGFYPRDSELRLDHGSYSPHVVHSIGTVASIVSFQESSTLLAELAGLTIGAKQVERVAESLGESVACFEQQEVEEPTAPDASTVYLGLDGTGVPMRKEELDGRQGKQADGSAKTREVKLVTVWTAEARDKDGLPVRDKGSVSYSAAIESAAEADTAAGPSAFAMRVIREAKRRAAMKAQRLVVIGDGARWIWNLIGTYFLDVIEIIDLFHAKGTISEAAKAIFGPTSEHGQAWAKMRRDELEQGELNAVIDAFRAHADSCKEVATCCEYLETNRARLDYPLFRSMGLCVSSGVVEAGCKWAVGARVKQAGMHWTLHGSNAIIALRCCRLSGRFEDFWEWKAHADYQCLGRAA